MLLNLQYTSYLGEGYSEKYSVIRLCLLYVEKSLIPLRIHTLASDRIQAIFIIHNCVLTSLIVPQIILYMCKEVNKMYLSFYF